jgi:demethylmenaquinone methyltransferase / 2-methoxy-6-polyprenyl-1,4-benzoquinol methylase
VSAEAQAGLNVEAPAPPPVDVQGMFDRIAGRYDAANRVMSAGVDILWRRKAIRELLRDLGPRPRLLDLGAGTMDGAVEIARRAPGAKVIAADFAREMLRAGRGKLGDGASGNGADGGGGSLAARIVPHIADGHALPFVDGAFDGAFSAFCVRNLSDLPRGMTELRRVIRPGGRAVILEFFRPQRTRFFFDKIYNARVLPLLGWAVSGDRAAYQYLPASIAAFRSGDEYAALLREVGFPQVTVRPLFPAGIASMVVAS